MIYYHPEPPIDPPEPYYITDDNGCEVYAGETIYTFDGRLLCPDCLREVINDLTTDEIAALLQADGKEVVEPKNRIGRR